MMSKCPFSAETFAELEQVEADFGDAVELDVHYVGFEKDGRLQSLYGEAGVSGDAYQLCARQLAGDDAWRKFLSCQMSDVEQIPHSWPQCARKAGIAGEKLSECATGALGASLTQASYALSKSVDVKASPTLRLNGETFAGGRRYFHMATAICDRFQGAKPAACVRIPKPASVSVTIIENPECVGATCDLSRVRKLLEFQFPGAKIQDLVAQSPEAKAMKGQVEAHLGAKLAPKQPLIVFGANVEAETRGFKEVRPHLTEISGVGYVFGLETPGAKAEATRAPEPQVP